MHKPNKKLRRKKVNPAAAGVADKIAIRDRASEIRAFDEYMRKKTKGKKPRGYWNRPLYT